MRTVTGKWRTPATREEIANRLDEALLEMSIGQQVEKEVTEKGFEKHPERRARYEPKGYSPQHTELIKRIDRSSQHKTSSWDEKGQDVLDEIEETKKQYEANQKLLERAWAKRDKEIDSIGNQITN